MDFDTIIQKFNINNIFPNENNSESMEYGGSAIVALGKRGSGKSTLIKWLAYKKRNIIPVGVVISGTENINENKNYSENFQKNFIYTDYKDEIVSKIVNRQKNISCENPWLLLIVDDCSTNNKNFNSSEQSTLFKNGRHLKILYILGTQYINDLNPSARSNLDGVFVFRETNLNNKKKIYEQYASFVDSFETFNKVLDKFTKNKGCIFIDMRGKGSEWYHNIFKVEIPEEDLSQLKTFKFGCNEYIQCGETRVRNDIRKKKR